MNLPGGKSCSGTKIITPSYNSESEDCEVNNDVYQNNDIREEHRFHQDTSIRNVRSIRVVHVL